MADRGQGKYWKLLSYRFANNNAAPPPLPGKKINPPPPPTEKKPLPVAPAETIPADESLTLGREDHLSHVTRPKGPSNRRPPSQILKEKKLSTGDEDDLYLPVDEKEPPDQEIPSPTYLPPTNNVTNGVAVPPSQSSSAESSHTPPSTEGSKPPWLKELRANQKKKRLSGLFSGVQNENDGQEQPPPPQVSPPQIQDKTPPPPTKPRPPSAAKPQIIAAKPALVTTTGITATTTTTTTPAPLSETSPSVATTTSPTGSGPIPTNRERPRIVNTNHVLPHNRSKIPGSVGVDEEPSNVTGALTPQRNGVVTLNDKTSSIENLSANGAIGSLSIEEKVNLLLKEILPKVSKLEARLDEQQALHAIQIQQLTKDVDEERKHRACLQIEVDRLSKLFKGGYTHV